MLGGNLLEAGTGQCYKGIEILLIADKFWYVKYHGSGGTSMVQVRN